MCESVWKKCVHCLLSLFALLPKCRLFYEYFCQVFPFLLVNKSVGKIPWVTFTLLWSCMLWNCSLQVESRAVYSHLMVFYNRTVLSFGELQASVNSIADTEQYHTQCLITHLLTNFLLFSSGGHMIAQEFISHVSGDCFVFCFFFPSPPSPSPQFK